MSDGVSTIALGEVASITMGQSPGAETYSSEEHGLPFLQGCAEFGAIHPQPEIYCDPPLRVAPKNAILISVRAPVGTMNLADQDYCIGRGLGSVQGIAGKAKTSFLRYAIAQNIGFLHRRSQGSTFLAISSGELRRLPIPDIGISTQGKIAEVLSTLDRAIENTEALLSKYQQIKAGLMHDLFTRGITADGKLRSPLESVETKYGWMPREWRIGSLIEATDPARQPILTGPFGADLGNDDFIAEGTPVLRIGNVQQGYLKLDDLLFVNEKKALALARYRIKTGDLLFARQGATTGRNALANDAADGSLINYHIIRVALDHGRCSPLFIEAAFNSEIIKRQIERDKGRGTREGINTAQLTSLAFPLAPVDEQRRISNIISAHDRVLVLTQTELGKLKQQKSGLMSDLLTGNVRVKSDFAPALT